MRMKGRKLGRRQLLGGIISGFLPAFFCLGLGCGGDAKSTPDNNSSQTNAENPALDPKEDSAPGRIRLGDNPDSPPVLIEMNGVLYQVFEIAEGPYAGKKVEHYPGGMEKRESIYSDGKLTRVTEFHQSGQKKMEVKVESNGFWKRSYWDNNGNPLQKAPIAALGRTVNWTFSVDQRSIDVAYRRVSSEVILKGFGEPDDKQNGVWIYHAMRVQTAQGLKTTVKFLIRNGVVFQVSVAP